jgi:hypothetical protein
MNLYFDIHIVHKLYITSIFDKNNPFFGVNEPILTLLHNRTYKKK